MADAGVLTTDMVVKAIREWNDGEPRVLDLTLAEWAGLKVPYDIRTTITGIKVDVESLGVLWQHHKTSGAQGGRPATEYWLNEEQCYRVLMELRTPRAREIKNVMAQVFAQVRQRRLVSSDGPSLDLVWQVHRQVEQLILPMLSQIQSDVADCKQQLQSLPDRLRQELDGCKRNPPDNATKNDCLDVLRLFFRSKCPVCQEVPLIDAAGNYLGEHDHTDGNPANNRPDNIMAFCHDCHVRKHNTRIAEEKNMFHNAAGDFQRRREQLLKERGKQLLLFAGDAPFERNNVKNKTVGPKGLAQ